jgi:DNA helicase HerA-like ATPase
MGAYEPTEIGRIRLVLGSSITIELDVELAGIAPIWRGQLQPIGQVGSIVRIPQGPVTLLATVTLVGISELIETAEVTKDAIHLGDRWIKAQLIGEINALGRFERGISSYPGLDDRVHLASDAELISIFPQADEEHVAIGTLSAAPNIVGAIAIDKLVTRHSAVVGSTGAGKTSAVATLLQRLVRTSWRAANIIVIDPHGEYSAALKNDAKVVKISANSGEFALPCWALPASDVLLALAAVTQTALRQYFADAVIAERRDFAKKASWVVTPMEDINADTPIPYDLRNVWYRLDRPNRQTLSDKAAGKEALTKEGDPKKLESAQFPLPSPTNSPPFKGDSYEKISPVPQRLKRALEDKRLGFFTSPCLDEKADPLPGLLASWLGDDKPVTVLDFSGVPTAVADAAIGGLMSILFDIATRCDETGGIGYPNPLLFVLEEAHRYLRDEPSVEMARVAVNRIAREGRKYGVGLMLISQRPSELPDTALSQVGSMIALRLTNGKDQGTVRAALPDAVAGLAEALPSLRNGEAIISGEASRIPMRMRIDLPDPPPDAQDPSLAPWREAKKSVAAAKAIENWRG